ncbi:hypothetical protein RFI_30659 [Reticulomyxa filosa]|uniref:Uncharacterized protein n=1 Tax=Reticulomyxa filosa TaxID=46433 RepID=X6LXR4_RETFI|nr:hypothetical protein RFI_30659 [Reticulomyxa filosa]|eukprot:ETO06733.1 hypothetical protein RFI_30659 [Reticulomyxa filosa]
MDRTESIFDSLIEQLKLWYPQQRQRFAILATTIAKCYLLMDNYDQLQLVAKDKQSHTNLSLAEKSQVLSSRCGYFDLVYGKGQHHSIITNLMDLCNSLILNMLQLLVWTTFKLITMEMLLLIHGMPSFLIILLFSTINTPKKKHYVWNNKENVCIDYSNHKLKVSAWYAEHGQCNIFHCITLFALFIHLFLNDHLNGIQFQQTIFLETVLGLVL